jgi:hypothetical protein
MADSKISALTAVTTPATTDEFAVNQGGSSKKMTLAQVESVIQQAGTSGAAPATVASNDADPPHVIYLLNTADNAVTTAETVMSVTSLPAGTYLFEYFLVWRSGATTTGSTFTVDYTGTVTRFRATRWFGTTGTTAATGVSDGVAATLTGNVVEHHSVAADNSALGPNTGVGATTEDQYCTITGIMVVSTSADLNLSMTGEGNGAVTFMADSLLRLTRLA